jgi:hypothetical protein
VNGGKLIIGAVVSLELRAWELGAGENRSRPESSQLRATVVRLNELESSNIQRQSLWSTILLFKQTDPGTHAILEEAQYEHRHLTISADVVPQQVFTVEFGEEGVSGHPCNALAMVVTKSGAVLFEAHSGCPVDTATACGFDSNIDLRASYGVIMEYSVEPAAVILSTTNDINSR